MNWVSGKQWLVIIRWGPPTLTMWIRGSYLCKELSMIWGDRSGGGCRLKSLRSQNNHLPPCQGESTPKIRKTLRLPETPSPAEVRGSPSPRCSPRPPQTPTWVNEVLRLLAAEAPKRWAGGVAQEQALGNGSLGKNRFTSLFRMRPQNAVAPI